MFLGKGEKPTTGGLLEKWIVAQTKYGFTMEFRICETCHCIIDKTARPPTGQGEWPAKSFDALSPCRCDYVKFQLTGST